MSGYSVVPFVIAYAREEVRDRLVFEPHDGSDRGLRLAYEIPRKGDRVGGVLRARVRDLRRRVGKRGPERMRKLNTRRQWLCMDRLLCQVCSRPATEPGTGRSWWILVPPVFEVDDSGRGGRTNAPPTCRACVDIALSECPMLRADATVCTVGRVEPAGVLADMYEPGPVPTLTAHNVYVSWDAFARHPHILATSQVVQLHDVRELVRTG
ncbi:hypothetical protein AB0K05_43455 [Nonomuraea sp. NPDC049486]